MRNILIIFFLFITININVFAKEVTIEIYKKKFMPAQITIVVGDTVTWKNIEKRQYHNVWFKQLFSEEPDYLFPDEIYSLVFNNLGEFPYECGPHSKMKGVITVVIKDDKN